MNKLSTLLGIVPVIESTSNTITNSLDALSDSIRRSRELEEAKFLKELAEIGINEEVATKVKKTKKLLAEMKEMK